MKKMTSLFKRGGAKLGQHFLTSAAIAETIAKESGAQKGVTVLEVGPGKGMLTQELLKLGVNVVAIEKDSEMVRIMRETFPNEIKSGQLTLIEGDARDLLTKDFSTLSLPETYSVAANIPYYITGELIRLFLTAPHQPSTIALLIQKEVAERIARSKKESILSLSVKVYGVPKYVQTVKAGSFNPPPKVDSAVLTISNISRNHFTQVSEKGFFDIVHAGFGQKRKTLAGNLKKIYGKEVIESLWDSLKLDSNVRAEDVPLEVWLNIIKTLTSHSK